VWSGRRSIFAVASANYVMLALLYVQIALRPIFGRLLVSAAGGLFLIALSWLWTPRVAEPGRNAVTTQKMIFWKIWVHGSPQCC